MYAPFVYAPDIIVPSHPFTAYPPGTTPDPLGLPQISLHPGRYEAEEDEDDIMPSETDDEALAAELVAEAQLNPTEVRAAAADEATCSASSGDVKTTRAPERGCGDERNGRSPRIMRWKTTLIITPCICVSGGETSKAGWAAVADMLKSPDGVRVKSAAVIEDSDDSDEEYLG